MPYRETDQLVEMIKQMLLVEADGSPVDTMMEILERERQEGRDVQVNPYALRDDQQQVAMLTKELILNRALEKWVGG